MPKLDEKIRQGNILKATTARFIDTFFASVEMDGIQNIPNEILVNCFKMLYAAALKLISILDKRGVDTEKLIKGEGIIK